MKYFFLTLTLLSEPAIAQESKPLDLGSVNPAMAKDFFGAYEISNDNGTRHCQVVLSPEVTIGGMAIDVALDCTKKFPVMGEVASWRLYENWEIAFADATRKELIRFTTPDNAYVATPETDGIATILRKK